MGQRLPRDRGAPRPPHLPRDARAAARGHPRGRRGRRRAHGRRARTRHPVARRAALRRRGQRRGPPQDGRGVPDLRGGGAALLRPVVRPRRSATPASSASTSAATAPEARRSREPGPTAVGRPATRPQALVLAVAVFDAGLRAWALLDLRNRPADEVNGPRRPGAWRSRWSTRPGWCPPPTCCSAAAAARRALPAPARGVVGPASPVAVGVAAPAAEHLDDGQRDGREHRDEQHRAGAGPVADEQRPARRGRPRPRAARTVLRAAKPAHRAERAGGRARHPGQPAPAPTARRRRRSTGRRPTPPGR